MGGGGISLSACSALSVISTATVSLYDSSVLILSSILSEMLEVKGLWVNLEKQSSHHTSLIREGLQNVLMAWMGLFRLQADFRIQISFGKQ